jgi:hypothetical protein
LNDSFENKKLTTTKSFTPRKVIVTGEIVDGQTLDKVNADLTKTSYHKPYPYSYINPLKQDGDNLVLPVIDAKDAPVVYPPVTNL